MKRYYRGDLATAARLIENERQKKAVWRFSLEQQEALKKKVIALQDRTNLNEEDASIDEEQEEEMYYEGSGNVPFGYPEDED